MAWTYSNSPATSPRDAVRVMTGDTTSTDPELSDEEIAFFLAQSAQNVYFASWRACYAIAARYAKKAVKSVGQLSLDLSGVAQHYRDQGDSWKEQGAQGATIYGGGVSVADKQAAEGDTDRVMPVFTRDVFRNSGTDLSSTDGAVIR